MLLIYGAAFLGAAIILTVMANLAYAAGRLSANLRSFLGGQTFGVLLASSMAIGVVSLFAFITELKTQTDIALQAIVAVALIAGGIAGARVLAKRAHAAAGKPGVAEAAGPRKRAA